MSQVNFEQVLLQVKALPPEDLAKLREYLKAQSEEEKAIEAARALARAASKRDLSAEYRWLREHGEEYVGQWVALKGDQLISHGPRGKEVHDAAVAAGHPDALMKLVQPDDNRPFCEHLA